MYVVVVNKNTVAAADADTVAQAGSTRRPTWTNLRLLDRDVRRIHNGDTVPSSRGDVKIADCSATLPANCDRAGALLAPAANRQ